MSLGLSGLTGTLQGMDALSLADALQQQQAQELAQRTQQATQGATRAGQAYQSLANQPAPDIGMLSTLIPGLFGNVASVLSGNPRYQEQGQQRIEQSRSELLTARAQNLAALKDVYNKQADLATKAGDIEAEMKARTNIERIGKLYDQVNQGLAHASAKDLESQRIAGDLAVQKLRNEGGLAEANVRSAASNATYDVRPLTYTTAKGQQFVNLGALSGKPRNAAILAAGTAGLPALAPSDAMVVQDVDRARRDINSQMRYLNDNALLPTDPSARAVAMASGQYAGQKWLQTNAQRAAYKTWRDAAIPILRGMSGGTRGLRIQQATINLVLDNLPKDGDTVPVADSKFATINQLLDNAEAPYLSRDWSKGAPAAADSSATSGALIRMVDPTGRKLRDVPRGQVSEAVKRGWKRSR